MPAPASAARGPQVTRPIARAGAPAALLFLLAASCVPWTVRPIGGTSSESGQEQSQFSAAAFVSSIWAEKVLPAVESQAVEAEELLTMLAADPAAARQRYGRRAGDGPFHYLVKGRGRVTALDAATSSRTLAIDLTPFDGRPDLLLAIGPVLQGTALRDAVGFLTFDRFVNQIQYAEVASELNDRVVKTVIAALDTSAIRGRTLAFTGVLTPAGQGPAGVIPVKLELGRPPK